MKKQLFCLVVLGLLAAACQSYKVITATPVLLPTAPPPTLPSSTPPATQSPLLQATDTSIPPTPSPSPSASAVISGLHVFNVRFALDVDENGEPLYPAAEFVFSAARVYVIFEYAGLDQVDQVNSVWKLNGAPVVSGTIEWGDGSAGRSVLWVEDALGVKRGDWTWELWAKGRSLGGGQFRISGQPGYVNEDWGTSFDPPPNWSKSTEAETLVSYTSPNQTFGLLLRVEALESENSPTTAGQAALTDLLLIKQTYPDAITQTITASQLSELPAVLSQIHFSDEGIAKALWVISAVDQENRYGLWLLSDLNRAELARDLLQSIAHTVRFKDKD